MDKRSRTSLFITLLVIVLCLIVCTLCYFRIVEKPIVYPDTIYSVLSMNDIDKSGEVNLIFLSIIFLSIAVLLLPGRLFKDNPNALIKESFLDAKAIPLGVLAINFLYFLIYGNFNHFLLECLAIVSFVHLKYEFHTNSKSIQKSIKYLVLLLTVKLFFLALFNIILILRDVSILLKIQHLIRFNSVTIDYLSYFTVITAILIFFKREDRLEKFILWGQKATPFALIYLLNNFYANSQTGEILRIPLPTKYVIFCALLIGLIFLMQFTKKNKKEFINLPFLFVIGIIKLVSVNGLFYRDDLWHTGEQLVPYEQIFTFNKIPFQDFFPSSGLYSILDGSLLEHIFNKSYLSMNYVYTFQEILFVLIIITLFYFIFDKRLSFVLVVFLLAGANDRLYFVFISCFLLQLKWLDERPLLWIGTWLLCCVSNVMIYPLYGLAFSFGFLPKAYAVLKKFVKNYKSNIKSKLITLHCLLLILSLAVVIIFIPLCLRMAKPILLFREYTKYVDGIPIVGTAFNTSFCSIINSEYYANLIYQLILLGIIILFPVIIVICAKVFYQNTRRTQAIYLLIFSFIYTVFSYNFTIIRMDSAFYLIRNASVYIIIIIIFFSILIKLFNKVSSGRLYLFILLICISVWSFTFISPGMPSRLALPFSLSDDYIYTEDNIEGAPNLGTGFIKEDQLNDLEDFIEIVDSYDVPFWSFEGEQSYYYILNKDVSFATAGSYVALSSEMQKYYLDASVDHMPEIIINKDMRARLLNYYIYRQLMLNHKYIITANQGNLVMVSLDSYNNHYSTQINSVNDTNNTFLINNAYGAYDLSDYTFASWGRSYNSLQEHFIKHISTNSTNVSTQLDGINQVNNVYTIKQTDHATITYQFTRPFNGAENDYIYLDLGIDFDRKTDFPIILYFNTTRTANADYMRVSCYIGDGHLLIPMGINPNWLLNEIDEIVIDLSNLPNNTCFQIETFELLEYSP